MEGSTNKCYVKVSSLFIVILFSFVILSSHQSPLIFCAEFLRGKEYVVDHVSRNGVVSLLIY